MSRTNICFVSIACLSFTICGCAAHEAKDAAKHLGASAFEQAFILFAFGPDALERHNKNEKGELQRRNNPYRSSFSREDLIEMQKRHDFEEFYEALKSPYGKLSIGCLDSTSDPMPLYCIE